MQIYRKLHGDLIRMLLQFAEYGALNMIEIDILQNAKYVSEKCRVLFPDRPKIEYFSLTVRGRKHAKGYRDIWAEYIVPGYDLPTDKIHDTYLDENAKDTFWGFSRQRLQIEFQEGRLDLALERSLNIETTFPESDF